mgnify:CR=1 FL=1
MAERECSNSSCSKESCEGCASAKQKQSFAEHYKLSANETFRKINCHLYLSAPVHQSTWNMFTLC